jgi:hypothetical protein
MWYKKEYPVGKKIKSYPSSHGTFPATVIGYREERNLNTGETTPIVRVNVHGDRGDFEEGFDPYLVASTLGSL